MGKSNWIFGIIGFVSTLLGFLAKIFYRDYINMNGINDFGFAGFLPSYLYVLGFSQLLLMRPTRYPEVVVAIVTLTSIGYEFMQYHSSHLLYIPDIIASIFGGITSFVALKMVQKRRRINNSTNIDLSDK